jgi:hypothetical protein
MGGIIYRLTVRSCEDSSAQAIHAPNAEKSPEDRQRLRRVHWEIHDRVGGYTQCLPFTKGYGSTPKWGYEGYDFYPLRVHYGLIPIREYPGTIDIRDRHL